MSITLDKTAFLAGYKAGAELRRLRVSGGGDSKVITWDGSTDGKVVITNTTPNYVKISDLTPNLEGATVTGVWTYGESISESLTVLADLDGMLFYGYFPTIVVTVAGVYDGLYVPETGLYVSTDASYLTITLP